ncbi:C5a anaphylatoxin chemotactic receptor 1 [Denticeps clupeoides]|uniref:G-protein coupled receptors family 1 profile domain-containing protein n=1 Tax=Denticeps clupeoides TaxID=299321 RepID=A0AAY4ECD0_9TELE|nr:C5a anaphylatoxin chemotactic receptor 1-like [Denticeps clupeoides]XP_028857494.1 C5a anaphylatoxin chemotactic receptor 1-like [Denticeps clupeoides]XP_028857495.1 C5a anaphylatoxin chemotactic receptor 1-like [Denticeps clupeoides]
MEQHNYTEYGSDYSNYLCNSSDCDGPFIPFPSDAITVIGESHIFALVCYALVFLLGAPGNALVAWVTAFRMPRSVNALWFLNLALADLLCCLSLPLLMVPLAQDQHWSLGAVACKLLPGLLYLVMYCSVLILVLISLDRWMLVSYPVWCQNYRTPKLACWVCGGVWLLALLGSIPQFIYMEEEVISPRKTECKPWTSSLSSAWALVLSRVILSFLLPFLVICVCHWRVYRRAAGGQGRTGRSTRTVRVIVAVVLSFFLCWLPLYVLEIVLLVEEGPGLMLAHVLALCLAYFNSCLNPLIYVCMGRGFKESITRSLRSVLHLASEDPSRHISMTHNTNVQG